MSTASVLVVDDEADIRALIQEILSDEGFDVTVAGNAAEARMQRDRRKFDLILLDIWMPDTDGITLLKEWSQQGNLRCPVVIMSGHGTVDTAVEATRLGAVDFVEKPLSIAKLLRTVEHALDSGRKSGLAGRSIVTSGLPPVGRSPAMKALREQAQQYAQLDSPVLIVGEPGTGRGAFAQYMHSLSKRGDAPIVTVVAAALTDSNAEEQLFGSEVAGRVNEGAFERAGNGTLVIEELSDLNSQAQKLILSAMEQGSLLRKGGTVPINVRARVIGTVKSGYESAMESGVLRRELVSSLSVLNLRVPPLREYTEDVPELLSHYVDKLVDAEGLRFRRFSVAAQNRLRNYPWPDNVRELKNLVRRMLLTGKSEEVTLDEIEAELGSAAGTAEEPLVKQDLLALPLREAREAFERAYLQQQLQLCDGKVGKLAARVGMERTHLYRKLRSLGVDFRSTGADD